MELVKDIMPESLVLNGQNPFTLLYRALSGSLHRVVLGELSESGATSEGGQRADGRAFCHQQPRKGGVENAFLRESEA